MLGFIAAGRRRAMDDSVPETCRQILTEAAQGSSKERASVERGGGLEW